MQCFNEDNKHVSASRRRTQKNMGKRPVKVVPVGAWVELEPQNSRTNYGGGANVSSAPITDVSFHWNCELLLLLYFFGRLFFFNF